MRARRLVIVTLSTVALLGAGCNHRQKDHAQRGATAVAGVTSAATAATSTSASPAPSASASPTATVAPSLAPAVAATPPPGSRYWYENDTLGQPLERHTAAEAAMVADVLALMNVERAKEGLAPFTLDVDAEHAAKAQAEDMTDRNYFSHVTPEGWTPRDRLVRLGAAPWQGEAENIALGSPTAADVVAAWMGSPMHRANILSPTFDLAGVGLAGGTTPRWVVVFLVR